MATYAVDIANGALGRLGQPAITTLTASVRDAIVCNTYYQPNRDVCLAMVNWTVLTQKVHLTRAAKIAITGITQATPPVVTTTSTHTLVVGDLVTVESVGGAINLNGGMFVVQAYTSVTMTLYDTEGVAIPALGYPAYTSGGYAYRHPGNDWDYIYDLPSDCIRPITVMDDNFGESDTYKWTAERTWVYTDVQYAALKYLKKNTDPTSWDDDMVEMMEARLAWLIAPRVTQDQSVKASMLMEWQMAFARARINNTVKKAQVQPPSTLWTSVR